MTGVSIGKALSKSQSSMRHTLLANMQALAYRGASLAAGGSVTAEIDWHAVYWSEFCLEAFARLCNDARRYC
jgi:hypothetical protein